MNWTKNTAVCFICCILVVCTSKANPTIPLVENGKSNYSISISAAASLQEKEAGLMLQQYIEEISGCAIPVTTKSTGALITVQMNPQITNPDGFRIKTLNKNIIIEGGNKKGCIYAVITLLEKYLGCRYYSSTFKVVPVSKTINLPDINISDEPKNDCRIINISDKVTEEFIDWNRLNTIDEYFAKGYYVHTFNRLVPWQDNFKLHPEYFALMNGKRIIDQLCLTNPEVLKLVLQKLESEMAEQPDKLYWSVSQNDNFSYCQCNDCNKIIDEEKSPAGPVIRFVNEVAKHFPDKIISTLAYQFSRPAPVVTKPLNNVQVMLCTIELNRSKSIEDEVGSKPFVKDIADWGKICKRIYLWDYTIDFANSVSPFPNLHVLQPNIRFFWKNNVRAHFQQSNISMGQEFSELKLYLISRLLWNPDADVRQINNDFLTGYYGKAAKWIKQYQDQLFKRLTMSGDGLDIYGHPTAHQNSFLSEQDIKDYEQYFDEAEVSVKNDSSRLMHVKIARLPLSYAVMEIGKNDMFGARGWYKQQQDEFVPIIRMKNLLEDFYITCKKAGVDHLNESGLSPKDYYESSKRFIQIQVKGNFSFRKSVEANIPPSAKYSNGDLTFLTNGVRGSNDYKVHWLGWEGQNFTLIVDLGKPLLAQRIEISSLWDPKSWILHPAAVHCSVAINNKEFTDIGTMETTGDQQKEPVNRLYSFEAPQQVFRFIKFKVTGTHKLFDWHPSAGGKSWVFIDEIVVK